MLRCRFYVNQEEVKNDYRPVSWPIKYPYWCSGESETDFILIAYVDSIEDLMKQWPEAHGIDSEEVKKIEFSSRFPKPDWYKDDVDVFEEDDDGDVIFLYDFEKIIEDAKKVTETGKILLKEFEEMKKRY